MLLSAMLGCGDWILVREGDALPAAGAPELPADLDLSGATTLRHFGLDALLRGVTVDEAAAGSVRRGVDYDAIVGSAEATGTLATYLGALGGVDPSALADADERLAYWMNAYNAWVLYGVAAKVAEDPDYDVESDGWAIFTTPYVEVDGWLLSPNDLEHGVIRGWADQPWGDDALAEQGARWHAELWGDAPVDARIHVGLNCASASCPNVSPGAFRAARVWDQLDALATVFLDDTGKGAGPDGVSQLFDWYGGDFAASFGSVEAFVAAYRTDGTGDVDFGTYLEYGWSLNRATAPSGEEPTCASPW